MTNTERAENAVMWYLYTHQGVSDIKDVLRLEGIGTPYISKAISNLKNRREIVWNMQTIRMTTR